MATVLHALQLERPKKRIAHTVYLDPDLAAMWTVTARKHKMRKVDIANQVFRAGLIALGELPPPAA